MNVEQYKGWKTRFHADHYWLATKQSDGEQLEITAATYAALTRKINQTEQRIAA